MECNGIVKGIFIAAAAAIGFAAPLVGQVNEPVSLTKAEYQNLLAQHDDALAQAVIGNWSSDFVDVGDFSLEKIALTIDSSEVLLHSHSIVDIPIFPKGYIQVSIGYSLDAIFHEDAKSITFVGHEKSITMTSFTQEWVSSFNEEAYCGYSNWQVGVPQDLTGLLCGEKNDPDDFTVAPGPLKLRFGYDPSGPAILITADYGKTIGKDKFATDKYEFVLMLEDEKF